MTDHGRVQFTLDQLNVMDTIHRLGSFAAAAQRLHRTPSAISYAIKTLESALDMTLFQRTGRTTVLTPAGELALESVQDILKRSRHLGNLGNKIREGWEPHLTMVVDEVVPRSSIFQTIDSLSRRGIPSRFRLVIERLSGVYARFEREDAQMMICTGFQGDPQWVSYAIPPVEMVLLAHRDHDLFQPGGSIDREHLHTHVEVTVADSAGRDERPPFHLAWLGSPRILEVSDFQSKIEAILGGIGFGWLPRHMVEQAITSDELTEVPFTEGHRYVLSLCLMHRNDVPLGPAARYFRDELLTNLLERGSSTEDRCVTDDDDGNE